MRRPPHCTVTSGYSRDGSQLLLFVSLSSATDFFFFFPHYCCVKNPGISLWSEACGVVVLVIGLNNKIGGQLIKLCNSTWRGLIKRRIHRAWRWQQVIIHTVGNLHILTSGVSEKEEQVKKIKKCVARKSACVCVTISDTKSWVNMFKLYELLLLLVVGFTSGSHWCLMSFKRYFSARQIYRQL